MERLRRNTDIWPGTWYNFTLEILRLQLGLALVFSKSKLLQVCHEGRYFPFLFRLFCRVVWTFNFFWILLWMRVYFLAGWRDACTFHNNFGNERCPLLDSVALILRSHGISPLTGVRWLDPALAYCHHVARKIIKSNFISAICMNHLTSFQIFQMEALFHIFCVWKILNN